MGYKHSYVDVRISRHILWIGTQSYPLRHIARVQPLAYIPDRGHAVWMFVKQAGRWLVLGVAVLIGLRHLGEHVPQSAYPTTIALVLILVSPPTVRFFRRLGEPNLYALSVETPGPQMALVSTNQPMVYDLARRITEAIDNPAVEFATKVEYIYGDKVYGDKFEGDMVHGDKYIGRDR